MLWERGPSTVRHVHDVLSRERPTAYTTALKLLQIMTEKGLVRRDEADRSHIYHRGCRRSRRSGSSCAICSDRAFGGSVEEARHAGARQQARVG